MEILRATRYQIKGAFFGVRGCSGGCSCNPCDCNPCTCGSDSRTGGINPARWRVSGCVVESGVIQDVDVSRSTLLCVAQPVSLPASPQWREVLLVDQQTSDEQVTLLLDLFADHLSSIPVEVEPQEQLPRSIYRVPLDVVYTDSMPDVQVTFAPETAEVLRSEGEHPQPWSYQGPMALRSTFHWRG